LGKDNGSWIQKQESKSNRVRYGDRTHSRTDGCVTRGDCCAIQKGDNQHWEGKQILQEQEAEKGRCYGSSQEQAGKEACIGEITQEVAWHS